MKRFRILLLGTLLPAVAGASDDKIVAELALDTKIASLGGELWRQVMPVNRPVPLGSDRPAGLRREPAYRGTPRYGTLRLGDGPNAEYHLVVEHEPAGEPRLRRLWIDANRNGDLTDDGDGQWRTTSNRGNDLFISSHPAVLHASWGAGGRETSAGDYAVMFVYLNNDAAAKEFTLFYRGTTARVGELPVGGRTARTVVIETDGDAVFAKPARAAADAEGNPLHLWIDANADGMFDWDERFDGRRPFTLAGRTYAAGFSPDGARLTLSPSTATAQVLKEQRIRRPGPPPSLLAAGTPAPDFTALKPGGGEMKLSDLRGQIVILDFWAPWCGPCKASMPSLDKLYQQTKDQGVVVLGLCVWDTREAFDKWLVRPQVPTTYPLAFDPAGRNNENQNADSIASRHYNVTGIPTFYVIGRDGRVVASYLGNSEQSKDGLRETLARLGVRL